MINTTRGASRDNKRRDTAEESYTLRPEVRQRSKERTLQNSFKLGRILWTTIREQRNQISEKRAQNESSSSIEREFDETNSVWWTGLTQRKFKFSYSNSLLISPVLHFFIFFFLPFYSPQTHTFYRIYKYWFYLFALIFKSFQKKRERVFWCTLARQGLTNMEISDCQAVVLPIRRFYSSIFPVIK